jgi:hypothetical protein
MPGHGLNARHHAGLDCLEAFTDGMNHVSANVFTSIHCLSVMAGRFDADIVFVKFGCKIFAPGLRSHQCQFLAHAIQTRN